MSDIKTRLIKVLDRDREEVWIDPSAVIAIKASNTNPPFTEVYTNGGEKVYLSASGAQVIDALTGGPAITEWVVDE